MKLAIKGHPKRGNEVIERLEMLGGINKLDLKGTQIDSYYYIDSIDSKIHLGLSIYPYDYTIYTLEEFLEKFPYKVGDKVWLHYENLTIRTTETIISMRWCSKYDCVLYDVCTCCNLKEYAFTPYKEETMEQRQYKELRMPLDDDDKLATEVTIDGNKILPPNGYLIGKITQVDNGMLVEYVKQQPSYPKTHEECFNICFGNKHHIVQVVGLDDLGDNKELFESFIKLKICRDAYWKIVGEQIGLGKPWKPDWTNTNEGKYCIVNTMGKVEKWVQKTTNKIFAFPTEEIRDIFYENFKDLIEQCKELL